MAGWLDRLGAVLLDASLAATAITGLVVLAMLQCRQPARRRGWARAGVLATLTLLPIAALNPVPRIDLRGPLGFIFSGESDGQIPWLIQDEPPNAGDHCPPPDLPPALGRLGRAVSLAYLIGATLGLGWIGLGSWGTRIVIGRGSEASAPTVELYESLPISGGVRRPGLLVSEQVGRPVLAGWFAPTILIPPYLDGHSSPERLRLSLLHELAHLEARDNGFGRTALIAQAFWFFLPSFWWIRDQMKLDQEFLADRRAVENFGTSGRYASALVDLAELRERDDSGLAGASENPLALPVPGVASTLVQRVQMLLKCPFPIEGETPVWWRWSTALTLAFATLAASCLTLRGLGGWLSDIPPLPANEAKPAFRIPQLVIAPGDARDGAFALRYRLPDEFTLTLEVLAEPDELPRLEILGHALSSPDPDDDGRQVYRLWHRVRIRRLQGFEFVEVDGQAVGSGPFRSLPPSWLTIRPLVGQPLRLRDIEIAW